MRGAWTLTAIGRAGDRRLAGAYGLVALICLTAVLCARVCVPAFADNKVDTGQLPDGSFIYEAKIADLSADNTYYDNQTVQITGEVVGDRIAKEDHPDYCWITVSALPDENAGSIQVLVTKSQADLIDSYGRYGVTGSTVRIMGTFHTNCVSDEGMEDLHATSLTVIKPGQRTPDTFDPLKILGGVALVVLGLFLYMTYHRYRVRAR